MKSLFFALFCLLASLGKAQLYLEPVIGYGIDVHKTDFRQINTALQLAFKKKSKVEMVVQLKGSWPLAHTSFDSAFSTNPAVPLLAMAQKKVSPAALTASIGGRIAVVGASTSNIFSVVPMLGIRYERMGVTYSYNKNIYTILNPDKTLSRFGLSGSFSAEYMHLLQNARLFLQLTINTPVIGQQYKYPSSFRYMFPLSINAGYSIYLKKSKS